MGRKRGPQRITNATCRKACVRGGRNFCCFFTSVKAYYRKLGDACAAMITHSRGLFKPCISGGKEAVVSGRRRILVRGGDSFIKAKRGSRVIASGINGS